MRLFRRLRLTTKLSLAVEVSTMPCAVIILAITLVTLRAAADGQEQERLESNLRVAWHRICGPGAEMRVVDGKAQAGTTVMDGNVALVDRLHELVGGVATIFCGTTRVATNIVSADGARATGTQLAPGPAYDAVVRRHVRYDGVANILGQPYVVAYDPSAQAATVNIADVSGAANDTGAAAGQVLGSASDLSKQAERPTGEVHAFVRDLGAA